MDAKTAAPVGVVITGVAGRMGAVLVSSVRAAGDLRLTGATEREGREIVGLDAGLVAGAGPLEVPVSARLEDALAGAQVVIDFTNADASLEHARVCAARRVPLVLGSTGFSAGARAEIAGRAREVPIVMAPNMSVGVNVLFRIAGEVARILGDDFDIEVLEAHHRHKKDAPSGTALRLVEGIADAAGLDPERDVIGDRRGHVGERPRRQIGVQAIRGGDVVGEHTVLYLGDGERLELTHKATSRTNFAQGALRAARWVVKQPPGLYDMLDVLGLAATARAR
jgi:4-hydroxy-tetrahydrodipicolinate reductase